MKKEFLKQMESFDYQDYISKNMPFYLRGIFGIELISHVETCCKLLVNELCGIPAYDPFVESLAQMDFGKAIDNADDANRIMISFYRIFLINKIPCRLLDEYKKDK